MENLIYIIIAFIFGAIISVIFTYVLKRQSEGEIKAIFSDYSQKALKDASEQFLNLAKVRFDVEQEKAKGNWDKKHKEIDNTVSRLSDELKRYENMVKIFEDDRTKKYSSIEEQIKNSMRVNENLQKTTQHLTSILANVKLRGQWGERTAEDILKYSGLTEGLHYKKNQAFEESNFRPDYIFELPDKHKFVMDVKFPLSKYLHFVNSENEDDRLRFKKEFINDVRGRIREITKKDYMPKEENTLDFVILFIPNEQVYSFINEICPGIIDEGMTKNIILCSPWSLYAVLKIIWEAWRHFHYSEGIKNIVSLIKDFTTEYEKFKSVMNDLGDRLAKTQKSYDEMVNVRQRQLDRKVDRVSEYRADRDLVEGKDESTKNLPLKNDKDSQERPDLT